MGGIRSQIGSKGVALVGFDFPIGIPAKYASLIHVNQFKRFLLRLGKHRWSGFYTVCQDASEISKFRPFYPRKPGGTKHNHLISGLNLKSFDDLRRRCEKAYDSRRAACPLFWTLGANQVGRAAIIGWRDVIVPALRQPHPPLLWPFDGSLKHLLKPGRTVIAETYPAEYYCWFVEGGLSGKTHIENRKKSGAALLKWANSRNVTLTDGLTNAVLEGFPDGDDAFDAAVGLFGMLEVVLRKRPAGEPKGKKRRATEGWILGQTVQRRKMSAAEQLDGISLNGFSEAISIRDLCETRCSSVPRLSGIYLIVRNSDLPPDFLNESSGGWFKGLNPSDPLELLSQHWVECAHIVYIGKGDGQDGLKGRLRQLIDFGCGRPIGHRGGRFLWHLRDSADMLVRWRTCVAGTEQAETDAIANFKAAHEGKRPFANLNK
jgi:hypothetical protein